MKAQSSDFDAQLKRVALLCELGRYHDAEAAATKALGTNPESGRALCLLAQARLGHGDAKGAQEAAARASGVDPENEWPHRLASIAAQRQRRFDAAVQSAREAVRLAPHIWQTHTRLASALTDVAGGQAEGMQHVGQALELAPHQADIHFTRGLLLERLDRRDDAVAAYETALANDPQHAVAINNLARLRLGKMGWRGSAQLADAAGSFAQALRTDPGQAVARRNLDLVLRHLLARTTYLLFLATYVVLRLSENSNAVPMARAIAVLSLAGLVTFAARFVLRLNSQLRQYLASLIRRPAMAIAAMLVAVSAISLVVGAFAPHDVATVCFGVAVATAILARLILGAESTVFSRRGPDRPPWLSTRAVTAFALVFGLGTLTFLAATPASTNKPAALITTLSFAALTTWCMSVIMRRRRRARASE